MCITLPVWHDIPTYLVFPSVDYFSLTEDTDYSAILNQRSGLEKSLE